MPDPLSGPSSGSTSGQVPVIQSMVEAWRFFFAHWTQFLPACALVAAASGIGQLLAGQPGPTSTINVPVAAATFAMDVIVGAIFSAAVLRKAVRDERAGAMGLTFGADEIRLIGVTLSLMLVFVPFVLLVSFVFAFFVVGRMAAKQADIEALMADPDAFGAALNESLGPGGSLAFLLLVLICFVLVIIVAARLAMVNAATIGERRIVLFQTWGWTRGNVARVLAALVITLMPGAIVANFLAALVQAPILNATPGAVSAAQLVLSGAVVGFIGSLLQIPLLALAAHLYKGLRPPDFVAK